VAPKGTPAAVLKTLGAAMAAAIDSPRLKEAFRQEGADPLNASPEEFEALIRAESEKYGKLIQSAGIKVE
jgi:tripartite-type tricarboxylate transporter receptor subunit TctC